MMTAFSSSTSRSSSLSSSRVGALWIALVVAVGLGSAACEDKHVGRTCDVSADGGAMEALASGQALECPTRICLKQAADPGTSGTGDTSKVTAPFCTAECSKDSDCDDGETRDQGNTADRRCVKGFVCGVAQVVGPFCCKKLCLCKDFLNIPTGGLQTPKACLPGSASSCRNK
jgi:hypothetical protein